MAEKLLTSGTWNSNSTIRIKGGQLMHFEIKNINILGTTITIESNYDGSRSTIILPLSTVHLKFTCFGAEPMGWTFKISTNSDAFIVTWRLYATWVPGDPENR